MDTIYEILNAVYYTLDISGKFSMITTIIFKNFMDLKNIYIQQITNYISFMNNEYSNRRYISNFYEYIMVQN